MSPKIKGQVLHSGLSVFSRCQMSLVPAQKVEIIPGLEDQDSEAILGLEG